MVDDDGDAILIDTATRRPIGTPFAVLDHPRDVAWSPDSRKIAVDSPDNSEVAVYDVQTRTLVWQADGGSPMAWSPTGSTVAATFYPTNVATVMLLGAADGDPTGGGWKDHATVLSLAYSPDGSVLASTGVDGSVVLREMASGQQLGPPLTAESNADQNVQARFDGRGRLVIATGDNGLWRLHIRLADLIHDACDIAGRNLTPAEWAALDTNHPYVTACP